MTSHPVPSLPLRPLGRSGLVVSALGFGVSGPHASALVRPAETAALLARAIEGGITLFDTAPFYGAGEAERRLGAAFEAAGSRSAELVVLTKVGTLAAGPGRWRKDFSVEHIRASLMDSRARLGLERLGGLLLHGPAAGDLSADLLRALEALRATGTVRALGIAGRGAELDAAIETGVFDLLMAPMHAGLGAEAQDRLARARAAGLGILGIEALAPVRRTMPWPPRRLADLWYGARALKRRLARGDGASGAVPAPLSAEAALAAAFGLGLADAIVTTTTAPEHLRANLRLVRSLDAAERGS